MRTNHAFIVLALILLSGISVLAQDLKVFGMEFGKPPTMSECPFAVAEGQVGRGLFAKKAHNYRYIDPVAVEGSCFKRVNNRFFDYAIPRSEKLPALTAPRSGEVKIAYSDNSRPGLLATSALSLELVAEVDDKSNLTRVKFFTDAERSKDILQTLVQKYGKYSSGKTYDAVSSYGSIREFSIYVWEIGKLKVTYQTLVNGTSSLSTVGTIEIIYQPNKGPIKDNNPL